MAIRKNIRNLSDNELFSLRNAFERMMAITDNRGYGFIAGIHGIPQHKCKHGESLAAADPNFRLFLPWHRAYIGLRNIYKMQQAIRLQEFLGGIMHPI